MKYIGHRFITYCRAPKKRKACRRWVLFIFFLLLILWVVLAELGLSAVSQELTEEAARGYLLSSMNAAIGAELEKLPGEFVSVTTQNGEASLLQANCSSFAAVKEGVAKRLAKSLNGKVTAFVPIGSLSGVGVLNGRGPCVPLRLRLEGSADVTFETEFISAGVNQSCHRVVMKVHARAYSQSKRFSAQIQEETEALVAETVVVGEVPRVTWNAS